MFNVKLSAIVILTAFGTQSVLAATLGVSNTAPTVDGADIALLPTDAGVATVNNNDDTTAVWAFVRPHQGQTFTTGSNSAGYTLSAFSLLHNFSGVAWTDTGDWDVQVGTIDGSNNFSATIASESIARAATFSGSESSDGTADWMTFTLSTPVMLAANTTYAFSVGINIDSDDFLGAVFVRDDGDELYTGGTAFSDSSAGQDPVGGFDNPTIARGFDRIFHVDLTAKSVAVPAPAALPMGLAILGLMAARRRRTS